MRARRRPLEDLPPPVSRTMQDLGTPAWVVELVKRMGPIGLDPCSNPWSLVDAEIKLSRHDGDCGLSTPWLGMKRQMRIDGLTYVNFPYGFDKDENDRRVGESHPPLWCAKIREEGFYGDEIITLAPCSPDTSWWEIICDSCDARLDVRRRIAFEGGEHGTGQVRSEFFYHGPRPWLFAHVFSEVGEPQVYKRRERYG